MLDVKMESTGHRDAILYDLINLLKDMTSDWEMAFSNPIGAETLLMADLGLKSIQMVQLVVAIEGHFKRKDLPFQELFMPNHGELNDLRVSELVDFLHTHLSHL